MEVSRSSRAARLVLRASLGLATDMCFTLAPILSPMPAEMIQHYMTRPDRRHMEQSLLDVQQGLLDAGVQLTMAERRQWRSLVRHLSQEPGPG